MPILEVLTYPHPTLKKKSVPVTGVTDELAQFADDMLETMYAAPGVGLAAPQVGRNIRLIVIDTRAFNEDNTVNTEAMTELELAVEYPLVLFNPQILKRERRTTWDEGCLSVPGFVEEVARDQYVECSAIDRKGREVLLKTDGLLAICIQHEIDHLDGKLFIDRLSVVKSGLIKSKIKKHGYPDRSDGSTEL